LVELVREAVLVEGSALSAQGGLAWRQRTSDSFVSAYLSRSDVTSAFVRLLPNDMCRSMPSKRIGRRSIYAQ
jgi:hypothetical protein